MTTKDYLEIAYWIVSLLILTATVYYIYYAPIKAVKIGRQLNDQQNKDTAKRNLFLLLFSLRGSPVHYDFVRGLNQIEVVFEDTKTVLDAWHTYYDSLQIKGKANESYVWELQRANLLSAMAVSLGYSSIQQTNLLQNYYPEKHEIQNREEEELRHAAKLFFSKGHELYEILIANAVSGQQNQDKPENQS